MLIQQGAAAGGNAISIELPQLFDFLHLTGLPPAVVLFFEKWGVNLFALASLFLLVAVMLRASSRMAEVPGRFQNAVEAVIEGLMGLLESILGSHARTFTPFLGTLFLFILFMNLSGLIPLMRAPTSQLEITLSLAIVVFVFVQITALRSMGLGGYLHHLMGAPRDAVSWIMAPLMLPLHIVAELARPISLALRLFGNIMGEDALIAAFTGLGVLALASLDLPVGIPLGLPFIFLGILFGTVQAFVFTVLSAVYIAQVLPSEGDAHGTPSTRREGAAS
jgi:F-type H+-transporting ATPase subunit a